MKSFICLLAFCIVATATTHTAAQEKVLATKISSPFKDVVWTMKKQPDSSKFGTPVVHDIPKRGKVQYGKHLGEDYWIDAGVPVLACADGYISLNTELAGTPERPQWGGIIVQAVWLKYSETEKVAFISSMATWMSATLLLNPEILCSVASESGR